MTASKRYMPEEDAIILKITKGFDPANNPKTTLAMLLDEVGKNLPGRNKKGIRDRYYRLTGIRASNIKPSYVKRLNPGPRSAYRKEAAPEIKPEIKPVPKIKPVSENRQPEQLFLRPDPDMVALKPMKHPAVLEPSSWIKPPSKAQLMSRTGRFIR